MVKQAASATKNVERAYFRPTWAEINLRAIRFNHRAIKRAIKPGVSIMAVVKANAYGHGSVEVSRALEQEGVEYLGVATFDEAVTLRKGGITRPILVMGPVLPDEAAYASRYDVTLTLCTEELLQFLVSEGSPVKVHVKIDTGMGRIGVWHEDAFAFMEKVWKCRDIVVPEGIYTHFSIAGRDKFFTQYQIDVFSALLDRMDRAGMNIPFRHAANSIAVIDWKSSHLNMVRPGLVIYGMYPKRNFPKLIKLKPSFALKTRIAFLKKVTAGRSISYGRTYITEAPTTIATLPIGYADGYGRILSNKAKVLVRGKLCAVVGKVTMDQTMIDVGGVKNVRTGDEVVLIGKQRTAEIKIGDLARLAGTIPYEIVTGITSRVPRIYRG